TMEEAGLREVLLPALQGERDGRLWRSVPSRRWYSDQRGETPGSQEVVLIHRKKTESPRQPRRRSSIGARRYPGSPKGCPPTAARTEPARSSHLHQSRGCPASSTCRPHHPRSRRPRCPPADLLVSWLPGRGGSRPARSGSSRI